MSAFDKALANVLNVEKGYVNHPEDRGGPTNLGVTLNTWASFHGRAASIADIQALTPETVAPIYRSLFWDPLRLDELPELLSIVVFNQAVLRGPEPATKSLQRALGTKVDGRIGPETITAALKSCHKTTALAFLRDCNSAYIRIIANSPDQTIFLLGWSNRIFDLLSVILENPESAREKRLA